MAVSFLTMFSVCATVYLGAYHSNTIEDTVTSFLIACGMVLVMIGLDTIDHPVTWERINKAMGLPKYIGCLTYNLVFIFGAHYSISYFTRDWNTEMTYLDLALTLAAVYIIDLIIFKPMHKILLHEKGWGEHWVHHLPIESSVIDSFLFHPIDLTLEFFPGFSMVLAGLFFTQSRMLYHTVYFILWMSYLCEHDSSWKLQHWDHHRVCYDYFAVYTRVSEKLQKDLALVDVQNHMKNKK